MEKILVLGTGAGTPVDCYTNCFILQNENKYLLVDTGSGSQTIRQIRDVGVDINQIHDIFISHKHIDHLLGIFYCLRVICQNMGKGNYIGKLKVYCSQEIKEIIIDFVNKTFHESHTNQMNENVEFVILSSELKLQIIGYDIEILDLYSIECEQYGFQTILKNKKTFSFLGDVPCSEKNYNKIRNTDWVCHEVFCQEIEKDKFNPHKINHSTIKDVCETMNKLEVKNIVLWHTKDNNIKERKTLYTEEAKQYYKGNIFVPNDLETIIL